MATTRTENEWTNASPTERSPGIQIIDHIVSTLPRPVSTTDHPSFVEYIKQLYHGFVTAITKSKDLGAHDAVRTILQAEEYKHYIDDCVRWSLLLFACKQNQSQRGDILNDEGRTELGKLLIQINPVLAFQRSGHSPITGEFIDGGKGMMDKFNSAGTQHQEVPLTEFEWKCSSKAHLHHKQALPRAKDLSPFEHAVRSGMLPLVDILFNQLQNYAMRQHVDRGFEEEICDALELAMMKFDCDSENMQIYMSIIERILNFNQRIEQSERFYKLAVTKKLWAVAEKILRLAPRDATSLTWIINILRFDTATVANATLDMYGIGDCFSLKVATWIMENNREDVWTWSRSQKAASNLIRSSREVARTLLTTAVAFDRTWGAGRILELSPGAFDRDVVSNLIRLGRWDMWETDSVQTAWESLKRIDPGLDFLTEAVRWQQYKFVESFVNEDPMSAIKGTDLEPSLSNMPEDRSVVPLWHNNFVESGKEWKRRETPCKDIRRKLVNACIKVVDNMQALRQILERSNVQNHTLRYARFPDLGLESQKGEDPDVDLLQENDEVFQILDWLRDTHMVQEIIQIQVLDRMYKPHDEARIGGYLDKFHVAILDWKCLDFALSVDVITPNTRKNLRELYLYWSGKRAVMSHWLSDTLNARKKRELLNLAKCGLKVLVKEKPRLMTYVHDRKWITKAGVTKKHRPHLAEVAIPKLWPFIKGYRSYVPSPRSPWRPTKIAVLDSGIMSVTESKPKNEEDGLGGRVMEDILSRIQKGRSFVNEDLHMGSWHFASDAHGTQMANLIGAVDPGCQFFVAQVTEIRNGVEPSRVVEGILWAIEQEVDIISMSFTIPEMNTQLQNAIDEAYRLGIVMLCSTHDEGYNQRAAYPADCNETIAIAAADEYGSVTNRTSSSYDFRLQATNIPAGDIQYVEAEKTVSGSSAATAIAAGLACLILSCYRSEQQDLPGGTRWKSHLVMKIFSSMTDDVERKYIKLEKFCGLRERQRNGEPVIVGDMVHDIFGREVYL
ncbi:hypothetical protein RJ55_01510 [Drechmeria coniospora]|nr:hypothetical protein RJ55_01510 [Drechmeria coniospora]